MRNKICEEKTLAKLSKGGYSPKAITEIVDISEKYRSRPTSVEGMLSEGYTPSQIKEVYGAARSCRINGIGIIKRFYDQSKKQPGTLKEKIYKIEKAKDHSPYCEHHLSQIVDLASDFLTLPQRDVNDFVEYLQEAEN